MEYICLTLAIFAAGFVLFIAIQELSDMWAGMTDKENFVISTDPIEDGQITISTDHYMSVNQRINIQLSNIMNKYNMFFRMDYMDSTPIEVSSEDYDILKDLLIRRVIQYNDPIRVIEKSIVLHTMYGPVDIIKELRDEAE